MNKLTIKQLAAEDRPREKMMLKGAEALSDAELLAILIGSGNAEESAVTLMQRVMNACGNDLNQLGKWEMRDFARFKGLGPAKSITIMAALELGRRRKLSQSAERPAIRCSTDIYELFHPLMCDLPTEEFWILLLNQAGKVIDKICISRGGIDQTTADVRTILREALLRRATQLILVHNHPLGQHPPQQRRPPPDRPHPAGRANHEHTPHRPPHRHRRQLLQLRRRRCPMTRTAHKKPRSTILSFQLKYIALPP